jgi:hypothetical protein
MGEERDPKWRRLVLPLAVALLAAGGYQLVGRASSPSDAPGAVAQQAAQPVVVQSWVPAVTGGGTKGRSAPTTLRLGGRRVVLHGPGVSQAHRETSAEALGRLEGGWLVALTSRACRDRSDSLVSYGTARASGRFALWDADSTPDGTAWRSPDRTLFLVKAGPRVLLRQSTGRVVEVFHVGS